MKNGEENKNFKNEGNKLSFKEKAKLQDDKNKQKYKIKWKIWLYFLILSMFIIFQYFITPVTFLIDLIFLSNDIIDDIKQETVSNIDNFKLIGWLLLFVLPLWNFIYLGIEITLLQTTLIMNLWTSVVMIMEAILDLPLTFFLSNNLHSMFLYKEVNFNQSLRPWLVFFPTNYHISWFEMIKNLITNLYFTIIGGVVYSSIKDNNYETFMISVVLMMIILNIFRIIGLISLLIYKICFFNSSQSDYQIILQNKSSKPENKLDNIEILDNKEKVK